MPPLPITSTDLPNTVRNVREITSGGRTKIIFVYLGAPDSEILHTQAANEGALNMAPPHEKREFPNSLYIPIHVVVMRSSATVLLLCILSLITSLLTKFNLVHPLFALLFAIGAIGFYLMGRMFEVLRKKI
jgi:hypothetical protein